MKEAQKVLDGQVTMANADEAKRQLLQTLLAGILEDNEDGHAGRWLCCTCARRCSLARVYVRTSDMTVRWPEGDIAGSPATDSNRCSAVLLRLSGRARLGAVF